MVRLILMCGVILFLLATGACKKESHCTDISTYSQNVYVMRDSIVYLHDSTSIIADTISFLSIPNSGGKYFIDEFGPKNVQILTEGCSDSFKVDTCSGVAVIYYGHGNITAGGNNISLTVTRVPIDGYPSDTALYYCTGVKQ